MAGVVVGDTEDKILDAALVVLSVDGISGLSMRAVAREADVALGLINYHFTDKTSLIAAALRRVGDSDATLVEPIAGADAETSLRHALRRIADAEFLQTDYLSLRLQLWSLARTDALYGEINHATQVRYRDGLAALIAAARPDLDRVEVERRAADILIIQNGMWLTSVLIAEPAAIARSIARCERIALG